MMAMGGPGLHFHKVRVQSRREETAELTLLRVHDGPDELYRGYVRPGQYVAVRLPEAEHPGYLAIASAPGESGLEFLVRGGGRFAEALRTLRPGDTVEVSTPLGAGFPLEDARGRDVWVVGAGSGIAALRPLVRLLAHERAAFGIAAIVFGMRAHGHVPFQGEIADWRAAGIDVHLALSRGEEGTAGHRGYVQDVLARLAPDLRKADLFVCGMPAMIEAVRVVAEKLGASLERVHTNA